VTGTKVRSNINAGFTLAGRRIREHRTGICAHGIAHVGGTNPFPCPGIISCDTYWQRMHLCADEPETHRKCRCACHGGR
jgi:hypothetical protein